jgi:hypothetical protein
MGEMKEEAMRRLFPCSKGGRRQPWRRREADNSGDDACSARLEVEEAGWVGWPKWPSGLKFS